MQPRIQAVVVPAEPTEYREDVRRLFQELDRTVGDDAFYEILQRWVTDHEGTSQRTGAFIALAEEVSGQDLTQLFDDWLFADDVPAALPDPVASA